jgi:hypothetical protein
MADVIDVFANDAFSMLNLSKTISHIDHMPGFLGDSGLYEVDNSPTTKIAIEEEYGTLTLVQTSPRGTPASPSSVDARKVRDFRCPRIAVEDAITADQVQDIRGYAAGQTPTQQLMTVQSLVDKKIAKLRSRILATLEFHRIGALRGLILDADGATLYNLFTEFSVTQLTQTMVLDTAGTIVINKIRAAIRLAQTALKDGQNTVRNWVAICGDSFFDKFTGHANVEKFYLNWAAAQGFSQQNMAYQSFPFGGVNWTNYRGNVGGVSYIDTTKAYLYAVGVPGLFGSTFGPSDYIDRVNQMPGQADGMPIEARIWMPEGAKSIKVEAQSNPLMLCTKPASVIELKENT